MKFTHYPHYSTRTVHNLDGLWDFVYVGDSAVDIKALSYDDRMTVPGVFDTCPRYLGKRGVGVYRTQVAVTPNTRGRLFFGGMGLYGEVYVDDELLLVNRLPYSGVSLDVPASPNTIRELVVLIDNRFDKKRVPLFEQFFDFYGYGGLYRNVSWHELPAEGSLLRTQVTCSDDLASITAKVMIEGEVEQPSFEIDGQNVEAQAIEKKGEAWMAKLTVPNPTPWSVAQPTLHQLRVITAEDECTERFGMRKVEARDGKVFVNGKETKLLGYCRHEAHPQFGPALPHAQLVQDIQTMKAMGCNYVRGSHYPQDQRFLDLCDELGMMVFEESLGWGQYREEYADETFGQLQEEQTRIMVRNSYNHPSIITWAFLNEGGSKHEFLRPLYTRLINALRDEDATRLVTYASMFPADDLFFELCDMISVNLYPGWYAADREKSRPLDEIPQRLDWLVGNLEERGLSDKPLLISEIGAGAIYGWRDQSAFHWSEEYQRDYLDTVCKTVIESDSICGVTLWQFCDCRTYSSSQSLQRPRAFNNKGTFDEYRRPKLAYETVRGWFTQA